jgi:hypothetical protein
VTFQGGLLRVLTGDLWTIEKAIFRIHEGNTLQVPSFQRGKSTLVGFRAIQEFLTAAHLPLTVLLLYAGNYVWKFGAPFSPIFRSTHLVRTEGSDGQMRKSAASGILDLVQFVRIREWMRFDLELQLLDLLGTVSKENV